MKNNLQKFQKVEIHVDEGQSRTIEITNLMQQLFQLRLVQKISRPVSFQVKEELFQTYKLKFINLHNLLDRLKRDVLRDNQSTNSKNKSLNSNVGIRQRNSKQDIRKIQARYIEIFIEGSFKYYYRTAKLSGLPLDLNVINIQEWADQCLEEQLQKSCCC